MHKFFHYASFLQYLIEVCSLWITIVFFSRLLYGRRTLKLVMTFQVYMAVNVFLAGTTVFYATYMLVRWRPGIGHQLNNPLVVFWSGIPSTNYMTVGEIPIFFLALDRCLSLRQNPAHTRQARSVLVGVEVACIVGVYVTNTLIMLMELPLQLDELDGCVMATCMLRRSKALATFVGRFLVEHANLVCSCTFLWMLGRYRGRVNVNDRIVKLAVVLDICLSVIPTYINSMLFTVVELMNITVIGINWTMCCALQSAILSIVYSRLLLHRKYRVSPNGISRTAAERRRSATWQSEPATSTHTTTSSYQPTLKGCSAEAITDKR